MKTRNLSNITRLLLCTAIAGGSLFATSPAVQPCAPTMNVSAAAKKGTILAAKWPPAL
jgi:hypothetical protein